MSRLYLLIAYVCIFLAGRSSVDLPLWTVPQPPSPSPVVDVKPPVPGAGKHLLVLEETNERRSLPTAQLAELTSADVRQWLKNNGFDYRFWDVDVQASGDPKWFQDALAFGQQHRTSLPWVVVSNGRTGFSGPLPENTDALLALLGRYE